MAHNSQRWQDLNNTEFSEDEDTTLHSNSGTRVQRNPSVAQPVSPQGRDPVSIVDADDSSAHAELKVGDTFETRKDAMAAIDRIAFAQNFTVLQDRTGQSGGSNFTLRCDNAFEVRNTRA